MYYTTESDRARMRAWAAIRQARELKDKADNYLISGTEAEEQSVRDLNLALSQLDIDLDKGRIDLEEYDKLRRKLLRELDCVTGF